MKRIVYFYFTEDFGEFSGETDAFFERVEGVLTLLASWSANDASYRPEYMNSLLAHFGVEVRTLPRRLEPAAKMLLREYYRL